MAVPEINPLDFVCFIQDRVTECRAVLQRASETPCSESRDLEQKAEASLSALYHVAIWASCQVYPGDGEEYRRTAFLRSCGFYKEDHEQTN